MAQTYQGYFKNGVFISPDSAKIPDNADVFVMITGNTFSQVKAQRQLDALDKFVSAVKTINDEPLTDDDFAKLENNRLNFSREIPL